MKIIVMDIANIQMDMLGVPDSLVKDYNVELFLSEHGYNLDNVSWMAADVDYVPLRFHTYGTNAETHEEMHFQRDARLKDFSIYNSVEEVKKREQKELVERMRLYGTKIEDGYQYEFDEENYHPMIAAYLWDEPSDVEIHGVRINSEFDIITLIGKDKECNELVDIDADDVFAGHLDYVTCEIGQKQED